MPTTRFPWHSVLLLGIDEACHGHRCGSCAMNASEWVPAPISLGKLCTVLLQAGQGLTRQVAARHGSDNHTHTSEWRLSAALPVTEVSQQGAQTLRKILWEVPHAASARCAMDSGSKKICMG